MRSDGTYVELGDEGVERLECGLEVRAEGICERRDEITSRRDQDGVVFSLVLERFVILVLIRVLLT